jgi:molybdopterin synthase catalytic subunit
MFDLTENPIDPVALRLIHHNSKNGALVSFEGIVRADEHGTSQVNGLLYHADKDACIPEGEKIIKEALEQFPITHAVCVQRIGRLNTGDTAVWIGVWAGHRDEAYKASRYIIEEIKKRLLIWKKEFHADGSSKWVQGMSNIL